MGIDGSSLGRQIRDYEERHPGLKSVLSAVGSFLSVESMFREGEGPLSIRHLPQTEEITAGLVGGKFVLKEKNIEIDEESFSHAFGRNLQILAGFYSVSDETGFLREQVGRHVGRLHQLDSREISSLITGLENLPGILPLVLLYFTARPFYTSFADHIRTTGAIKGWTAGYCPVCGQPPFMARLEEEDGARFLECGLCATTWRFPRLACPFCDSPERAKNRFFYVPGDEGRRVYVCEDCKTYIKTVDVAKFGRKPVLLFEFVATPHLDLLAERSGYVPPDNLASALVLMNLQQDTSVN